MRTTPAPVGARNDRSIRVLVAGDQNLFDTVTDALDADDVALIERAATGDALVDKLSQAGFDCVVVDRTVGRHSSLAIRETLVGKTLSPPPMVMFAREGDARTVIEAFRNGFSDFVVRDGNYAKELIQGIRRAVIRSRKMQSLLDEVEYLSKMAKYDRLTGLPNRNFLEDRIDALIASAERHGNDVCVLLIDVNNFRKINDIHGHAVGDQVLKAFARKLMQTARSSDALGRFGGDEFLYLIDRDVSPATVERACLRLEGAVSFAVELETAGMSLSASIGAAIYPGDGRTQDALLTAADSAMYAAKANGTGYCMASAATQPRNGASPTNGEGKAADGHAAPAPAEDQTPRPARPGERSSVAAAAGATGQASVGHRSENRRSERRHRVFKRGRIIFGDGFSTIDCMIRDLSQRGARISVEDQLSVPSRFSFAVLDSGEVYIAARRWQRGRSIGLEFLIDPGHPAAD